MIESSSLRPENKFIASIARRHNRGFTLAEVAIAFFIISLLLASALIPLSTQVEIRNISDTKRVLDQFKEALIGFAQVNGRLPCPARPSTPTGQTSDGSDGAAGNLTFPTYTSLPSSFAAGKEQYDSSNKRCYATIGVLPWTTLGVPETDAWGRRFTYRVATAFADDPSIATSYTTGTLNSPAAPQNQSSCTVSPTPSQASFASCALGEIAVLQPVRSTATSLLVSPAAAIGTGLAAVIVSHGKNGIGGWQSNGVQISVSDETSNEASNATLPIPPVLNGSIVRNVSLTTLQASALAFTSYVFYSRNPTQSANVCSDTGGTLFCEFDDIVYMISTPTLVSRMVAAGRFP